MTTEFVRGDPECHYKHMVAEVGKNADPDARDIVPCFMSTDSVDGDDEVMLPGGIDLSRFRKNPVVMLCHAMGQPGCYYPLPVGRSEWEQKRTHGVMAGVKFTDRTPMGREVKALFDDDMLRSFSVGFRPVEASPMTFDEAQTRPDWKAAYERTRGRINVHRRWLMLELSVAPVPSNPDALVVRYKSKGILVPAWLSLPKPKAAPVKTANTTRFDLGRKALDDAADGIAAVDVTPADARVMVALWVPPETASAIAVPGGEAPEDLHLTLCYLGRAIEIGTNAIDRLKQMCRDVAASTPPLLGKIGGMGRFSASDTSDGKDVIYASADLPGLAECRQQLASILQYSGIAYSQAHGFTPHITLAYVDPEAESPVARIEPTPVAFTHLCLSIDGEKVTFPFNAISPNGPVGYAYRNTEGTTKGGKTVTTIIKCAMGKALSLGSHVRDIGSGMCGEVKALHTEGTHPFDSSGEDAGEVEATEDDPVAHVHQHDDDHARTGRVFAVHAKGLASIPDEDEGGTETGEKAVEPAESRTKAAAADDDEGGMSPDAATEETAEDLDDGEDAEGGGFKKGHHVKIKAPHYKGFGVVHQICKQGHVPHVKQDIMGTEDDPAASVRAYKAMGDGHAPTDDYIGVRCKHLTPMPEPMRAPAKEKAAPNPPARKAARPPATPIEVDPLPPLVALSEEQLQLRAIKAIEDLPLKLDQAIERRMGCV